MPTRIYKTPPVTPEAHLGQLIALKDAEDADLSSIQRAVRKSLLNKRALRALRLAHVEDMVIAGFSDEQIKIAFAHPDSNLLPLLEGFTGNQVYRFNNEITDVRAKVDGMGTEQHRELYLRSRSRLLNACWGFLGKIEPAQAKALLELMDKLMQDIAESSGVLKQRAGKRPRPITRRGGREIIPATEEAAAEPTSEDTPMAVNPNWEGDFEADDYDPANPTPSEK